MIATRAEVARAEPWTVRRSLAPDARQGRVLIAAGILHGRRRGQGRRVRPETISSTWLPTAGIRRGSPAPPWWCPRGGEQPDTDGDGVATDRASRLSSLVEAQWSRAGSEADVAFTIFGPHYGRVGARREVIDYADVTAILPPARRGRPPAQRLEQAFVRGLVSRRLLRRADRVLVEAEAFAATVRRRVPRLAGSIDVVPNCLSTAVLSAGQLPQPTTVEFSSRLAECAAVCAP